VNTPGTGPRAGLPPATVEGVCRVKETGSTQPVHGDPHALDRGERETLVVPMARGHSAGRGHGLHPARRWRAMVRIEHTRLVGVWPPNRAKAIARKPHHTTKVTSAAKERVLQKSKDHALGGDAAPLAADERRTRAQGYRTGAMQDPVCGLPRTLYY